MARSPEGAADSRRSSASVSLLPSDEQEVVVGTSRLQRSVMALAAWWCGVGSVSHALSKILQRRDYYQWKK